MNWSMTALALGVGYVCGSISFARIVYAWRRPGESPPPLRVPTLDGEAELVVRNAVGGTTVMLALGPRWGMLVSALDMAKAFFPTLVFLLLAPGPSYLAVAVGVLVGHLWPVWYRFIGGGGNSVIIGGMLAVSPVGLLVTQAAGGAVGMFYPAVTFLAGNLFMVPWFWWRAGPTSPEMAYAIAINVIYLAGQVPHAIETLRMKRAGHPVDTAAVIRQMKEARRLSNAAAPGGSAGKDAAGE